MLSSRFHSRGFTLIELLVVLAIVGILTAVAIPAYGSFVKKGKVKSGQADLMALMINMESYYQRSLSYPSATLDTASTKAFFSGWSPAQSNDFKYVIASVSGLSYTLQAVGISNGMSGCTISLASDNTKTMTNPCGGQTW